MKFVSPEEYKKMKPKDKGVSLCPFCEKNINHEYVVWSNDFRWVKMPLQPYWWPDRWKRHLMAIPKKHHKDLTTLSDEEVLSKREVDLFLATYFEWVDYFSFVRLTDEIKSIQHLHLHYVKWNILYEDANRSLRTYDQEYW